MNAIAPAMRGRVDSPQGRPTHRVLEGLLSRRGEVRDDFFKDVPMRDLFLACYDSMPSMIHLLDIKCGRVIALADGYAMLVLAFGASSGYFLFDERVLDGEGNPLCLGGVVNSCGRDTPIGTPVWSSEKGDAAQEFGAIFDEPTKNPMHDVQFANGVRVAVSWSMRELPEQALVPQSILRDRTIAFDFLGRGIMDLEHDPSCELVRHFSEHTAFTRVSVGLQPDADAIRVSGSHDYYPNVVLDNHVFGWGNYERPS